MVLTLKYGVYNDIKHFINASYHNINIFAVKI